MGSTRGGDPKMGAEQTWWAQGPASAVFSAFSSQHLEDLALPRGGPTFGFASLC